MKCVFPAKIWFVKTSTRIMKYEPQVIKSSPVYQLLSKIRVQYSHRICSALKTLLLYQKLTQTFTGKKLSNINALIHGINHKQFKIDVEY